MSNDNPYSEAQFKTLKYCPSFPERFGSIADARAFCESFFAYYNHEHRHSGIGYHTPASVHYGTAAEVRVQRAATLDAAYAANPTRFRHRKPEPPKLPTIAWINEPVTVTDEETTSEGIVRTCLKSLDRFRSATTRPSSSWQPRPVRCEETGCLGRDEQRRSAQHGEACCACRFNQRGRVGPPAGVRRESQFHASAPRRCVNLWTTVSPRPRTLLIWTREGPSREHTCLSSRPLGAACRG